MLTAKALHEGDDVLVGTETVAELFHFDGSTTRLDTGATAALERIADADGRPHVVLRLGPGNSWHRTAATRARGGHYEARTASAAAQSRTGVFVVRSRPDGTAWFAALDGTVIVRGTAGGTVVLRAGEEVTATAEGTLDEVSEPGPEGLAADDWVAVNGLLDDEEAAAAPAPAAEAEATVAVDADADTDEAAAVPSTVDDHAEDEDEFDEFVDDDHPWRVGVAAAVAISIAIFSVVIGRAGTATPVDPDQDPAIAVPGPPAFATPAFPARDEPVTPAPAPAPATTEVPATTASTAPPTEAPASGAASPASYELKGKSCSRGGTNVIVYQGTLHNTGSVARSYTVHVQFSNSRGTIVARASDTVTVPAGGAKPVRAATAPLRNARAASTCDVERVTPA